LLDRKNSEQSGMGGACAVSYSRIMGTAAPGTNSEKAGRTKSDYARQRKTVAAAERTSWAPMETEVEEWGPGNVAVVSCPGGTQCNAALVAQGGTKNLVRRLERSKKERGLRETS